MPDLNTKSPQNKGFDFVAMEKKWLSHWYASGIVEKYLHKNDNSDKHYSFFDGPITANNPMAIHHAWGRTYKDTWQKFFNLQGCKERFQNGFDCQGLWVEVEVEKELKLKSKKEIENLVPGDVNASIAKFVSLCRERVEKFSALQTEQSKRLGYFMDWNNSYYTMSAENNYMIWHFLKRCYAHGWIYKGWDSVPWCPRCETAISQHEMLTEDYKEITHETIFVKLPIITEDWKQTSLLIWTTTPWTMPANVAVGVNIKYQYGIWEHEKTKEKIIFIDTDEAGAVPTRDKKDKMLSIHDYILTLVPDAKLYKKVKTVSGKKLLGLKYEAPFDFLPRVKEAREKKPKTFHTVIDASKVVVATEGTGLLHVAPGAGTEDFQLGKQHDLSVISLIDDTASYLDKMGEWSRKNAKKHPEIIIDYLRATNNPGYLHESMQFTHRYPACWRCKTELVWKVADEWYIAMDIPSKEKKGKQAGKTLREMMKEVANKITWMPSFGLERELDWLSNMHDWLISKKNRYWGLALPIWETEDHKEFEVIGGFDELKERTVEGWEQFEGRTPHKPYIDTLIITSKTGKKMKRVNDVGNVWLDAGIIPFSTLIDPKTKKLSYITDKKYFSEWFPANFITESFPGQFKNWFYALIAEATVLEYAPPFERVLGYGTVLGEDGRPMHKSWGNAIEFNEGADKIGVDIIRWMFARHNPADNTLFGYKTADEVRRMFYLILWNVFKFYTEYKALDGITNIEEGKKSMLDQWILSRLELVKSEVETQMRAFDAKNAVAVIETFISDLSTWYLRRSRDRVWLGAKSEDDKKAFYSTMHTVLTQLAIILSPFVPFLTEELYTTLTKYESVHLAVWPEAAPDLRDEALEHDMQFIRNCVEVAHRKRKELAFKVRQPLTSVTITSDGRTIQKKALQKEYDTLLCEELNVKKVLWEQKKSEEIVVEYDPTLTEELKTEGELRDVLRKVQVLRKEKGLSTGDRVTVTVPEKFKPFAQSIKKHVALKELRFGETISISD